MKIEDITKLIVLIFFYIAFVFPLTLFTEEEVFPFSRFPMYAHNTLTPCGYQIHLNKSDEVISLGRYRAGNLFLKYSRDVIEKNGNSNLEMCQFIQEVFWPKKLPYDGFYVKRYCTDVNNLPSLEFREQILLICQ